MTELSATIRLRPTRIGFLVRPTDLTSIRRIMRSCTCLWGGAYNPIIPVFRVPPREWRTERFDRARGLAVAKGYVNFFEPDVFVECEEGLLEEIGLGALREKHSLNPLVATLKNFLEPQDNRDWSEPVFGLSIVDAYRHLYDTEHRFQSTEKRCSVIVRPNRGDALVEGVFGAFPQQKDTDYIAKSYRAVFAPQEVEACPDTWLKVFKEGATTPLRVTRHRLEAQRFWHHYLVVYVFNPTRPTDLVDLWNLRLEPRPVLPVPDGWFESLVGEIREVLKAEHRPVRGNPHGVMHHATIEFARSVSKKRAEELTKLLTGHAPVGALTVKHRRNPIWIPHTDDRIHRDRRLEVTAEERRTVLKLREGRELRTTFEALAPRFASRFGGHHHRWVNAVSISAFGAEKCATVFPFNVFDRRWPPLRLLGGDYVTICTEGWIFSQHYKNSTETLDLLRMEDAISGSLERMGIEAQPSDPGHVAKQMLDHLGGLWAVHMLADLETVQLMNRMAGGLRRRVSSTQTAEETVEETFELRSAPAKDWRDLVAKRREQRSLPRLELSDFTNRNVIRLGLETVCPHCQARNWHSLTAVDYRVACDRCLNSYDFPQASFLDSERNWSYRVIGPFSVPDYGRGAYSALLALRVLKNTPGSHADMTFSTAMNLKINNVSTEVDFVAWRREERLDAHQPPDLIVGETKSLGQGDLIKPKDLEKLAVIGRKLPGATIVIAVLRDDFTTTEKKALRQFVKWGRRPDDQGRPTNSVILLTAHELFFDLHISATWKNLGEPHKSFSDYEHTRNLHNFADATQRIYLGLPSFYDWSAAEWKKRAARRNTRAKVDGQYES